jgi:predicted NodU family carbamoyl transferase
LTLTAGTCKPKDSGVVILGLGDGLDAAASLVIDDEVVAVEREEHHDRTPRSRAFPWQAIEAVLEEAGLRHRHVDEVGLAGRFSPPFFATSAETVKPDMLTLPFTP